MNGTNSYVTHNVGTVYLSSLRHDDRLTQRSLLETLRGAVEVSTVEGDASNVQSIRLQFHGPSGRVEYRLHLDAADASQLANLLQTAVEAV